MIYEIGGSADRGETKVETKERGFMTMANNDEFLRERQSGWRGFTRLLIVSVVAIATTLALMGFFLT